MSITTSEQTRVHRTLGGTLQSLGISPALVRWKPVVRSVVETAALLTSFILVTRFFSHSVRLPQQSYDDHMIFIKLWSQPPMLALAAVLTGIPLSRWRQTGWDCLPSGRMLRWVIAGTIFPIAIAFSLYEYNFYYGQFHPISRTAVMIFSLLSLIHPAFIAPMLVTAGTLANQFNGSFGTFSWTDKQLLFYEALLFSSFVALRPIFRIRFRVFLMLFLSMWACHYTVPLIAKLKIMWWQNELKNLWVGAYLNGWGTQLSEGQVMRIADVLGAINPIALVSTIVSEGAPLFILIHRRYAVLAIVSTFVFHCLVFACTGIFFWKWMIFGMSIAAFLAFSRHPAVQGIFGIRKRFFWLSIPVILFGSSVGFTPRRLAWLDTPFYQHFTLKAEDTHGRMWNINPNFLEPYDMIFAQNRFGFLYPGKLLTFTLGGTTSPKIYAALRGVKTSKEVVVLIDRMGRNDFDLRRRNKFDAFLKRYFRELSVHPERNDFLGALSAPHHIWTSSLDTDYRPGVDIRSIHVVYEAHWYDGQRIVPMESRTIHSIAIDSTPRNAKGSIKIEGGSEYQCSYKRQRGESSSLCGGSTRKNARLL